MDKMNSGIINIYKEKDFTSFDVVAKLRGILHIKKIGHTGTLDPDATGVLPICVGKATKVCDLLTCKDKIYKATMLLGVETDTYDISGKVLSRSKVIVSEDEIINTLMSFVGDNEQVPPMYSALKINGKKLYELAREGKSVERKPREITIYNIEIIDISLPYITFYVHCSKGTYIRSICHDVGEKLGIGACLSELVRIKVSEFEIQDAYKLSQIEDMVKDNDYSFMRPIDSVFYDFPAYTIRGEYTKVALNGCKIYFEQLIDWVDNFDCFDDESDYRCRIYLENGSFVGIYSIQNNYLKIEKMFYENF